MGECGGGGGLRFPVPHAIGAQAVEFGGVVQSGLVALALLSDHMQNNGFVEILDVGKGAYQGGNVVSVQGAEIAQPEFVEQQGREDKVFGGAFQLESKVPGLRAAQLFNEGGRFIP